MQAIFKDIQPVSTMSDDDEKYRSKLNALIADAVDFEENYLAPARFRNQSFYNGISPELEGAGDGDIKSVGNKSSFVSTDVRDTIMTIMPSLMRIFTSADTTAEFVPNTEEQSIMAEQMRDYVNYVMHEDNPGFMILHSVFKDALTLKIGVVKWWTDNSDEISEQHFSGVTEEQIQMLEFENPNAELITHIVDENGLSDITMRFVKSKPMHKIAAVPPEEFRVSRTAKSVYDTPLIGQESIKSVSDLVKMGYEYDDMEEYVSSYSVVTDDRILRNAASIDGSYVMDGVLYGEYYVRIDKDGDGIDELRRICTVGSDYEIVEDEMVDSANFAVFGCDPISHTLIGDCVADITKDIQKFKTNLMRGQLDSLAESLNPRTVVNELLTNIEDVLNDEVGAVIRTRGDPSTAVSFSKSPYSGADVQVTVDYFDQVRASRTGVTEASKGLDPKALQSTALSGIDAIVSGAQERIELIARVLAETGLKPLLKGLALEVINHPNQPRALKLRGSWQKIDPSTFDPTLRVSINPTLGKGTDTIRLQALQEVKQTQLMILEKYGINNPVVSPVEFRNTVSDILAIANIKNVSRYFKDITPDIIKSMANVPQEPDAATLLAQAELEKVKKDILIATGDQDLKAKKIEIDAASDKERQDFDRDKLNLETAVALAQIDGSATAVNLPDNLLALNQGVENGEPN
jgi:hypothetical protein